MMSSGQNEKISMRRKKDDNDSVEDHNIQGEQGGSSSSSKEIKPLQFVQAVKTDIELVGGGKACGPPKEVESQDDSMTFNIPLDEVGAFFPSQEHEPDDIEIDISENQLFGSLDAPFE